MKIKNAALSFGTLVALVLIGISSVSAKNLELNTSADKATPAPEMFPEKIDEAKVRQALLSMAGTTAEKIQPSLLPGIAEVLFSGNVVYITNDGRYIINGDLFDTQSLSNVSEKIRSASRADLITEEMDKGRAITFKTKDEPKHRVALFTDIDCGYCREFHKHIDEFIEIGIEINYYMMPRAGVGSPSYYKALNAVCAKNPQEALTLLKQGQKVEDIRCSDNSVIESLALAKKLGVRGTPGMVTMSGALISGYRQPQEFIKILDQIKADQEAR